MLVDIDFNRAENKFLDGKSKFVKLSDNEMCVHYKDDKYEFDMYYAKKLHTGVYETDLNYDNFLEGIDYKIIRYGYEWGNYKYGIDIYDSSLPLKDKFEFLNRLNDLNEFYGVADSPEQIIEHPEYKKQFINSKDKYILCVTPIYKENQEKYGGWRWHKWGRYIGNYDIQHEYLYDEDIDVVYVFHFYMIKE